MTTEHDHRDDHEQAKIAFLQLYDEMADGIFKHCYYRVSDRELARDLMQEAFARTWRSIADGKDIRNLKAYIYRVAHNLIVDSYRRPRTASIDADMEQQEDSDEHGHANEPADATAHEMITNTAEHSRVLAALEELDRTYREVIVMRFMDGLPPKDIARIIGETENVVSVRINRGLKQLRVKLDI